jgi:hypothetical protein
MIMSNATAQIPENLVVEGVPAISPELRQDVSRYLEFRAAVFNSWHPVRREMLVTTRFAESMQLHAVKIPGAPAGSLRSFPSRSPEANTGRNTATALFLRRTLAVESSFSCIATMSQTVESRC